MILAACTGGVFSATSIRRIFSGENSLASVRENDQAPASTGLAVKPSTPRAPVKISQRLAFPGIAVASDFKSRQRCSNAVSESIFVETVDAVKMIVRSVDSDRRPMSAMIGTSMPMDTKSCRMAAASGVDADSRNDIMHSCSDATRSVSAKAPTDATNSVAGSTPQATRIVSTPAKQANISRQPEAGSNRPTRRSSAANQPELSPNAMSQNSEGSASTAISKPFDASTPRSRATSISGTSR
ncbi:MAG: hypothetical protein ACTHLY_21880, partial [Pseudolabrys sp.]